MGNDAAVTMDARVAAVGVADVRVPLPAPIVFGDWVIRERAFAVAAVRATTGEVGYAFTLTRDGPVAAMVRRYVAPRYLDASLGDPSGAFHAARGSARPVLGSGVGLRALSIVDIAAWDCSARVAGRPFRDHLGGTVESLPAMGVAGYPPSIDLDGVAEQARTFQAMGLGHLKLPMVGDLDGNRRRLEAAAPHATRLSTDGGWSLRDVADAEAIAGVMPLPGWLEDPVAPERVDLLAAIRRAIPVEVAMGDEQGGPGFPDALLLADAVDVVRLDASCAGGVTGLRPIVERVRAAGVGISFHVYAAFHAQIAAGLGVEDAWVEWSLPGTLVDAITESQPLPMFEQGRMRMAAHEPGLGRLWDPDWMREQRVDDPDGLLAW